MVKGAHHLLFAAMFCMTVSISSHAFGLDRQLQKYTYNNNGHGAYSFEYETSDGTFRREEGGMVPKSGELNENLVVRGEFGYMDTEGRPFYVRYIADSNGYQPQILTPSSETNRANSNRFQPVRMSGSESSRFNDRRIF